MGAIFGIKILNCTAPYLKGAGCLTSVGPKLLCKSHFLSYWHKTSQGGCKSVLTYVLFRKSTVVGHYQNFFFVFF